MVWNVDILTVVCGAGTLGRRRTAAAVLYVLTDGFGIRPHLLLDGRLALRAMRRLRRCHTAAAMQCLFLVAFEFFNPPLEIQLKFGEGGTGSDAGFEGKGRDAERQRGAAAAGAAGCDVDPDVQRMRP